jgi:hypothetical protein
MKERGTNGRVGRRIAIASAAAVIFAFLLFQAMVGFYCKVPAWDRDTLEQTSSGETVMFRRRHTVFGFLTTADGLAIDQGFSPSAAIRDKLDAEFEVRATGRVIARYGFSRLIYLATTGGVDLYTPPKVTAPDS